MLGSLLSEYGSGRQQSALGLKRPNNSYLTMGTGCAEANVRLSDTLDIRLGVSNVALDLAAKDNVALDLAPKDNVALDLAAKDNVARDLAAKDKKYNVALDLAAKDKSIMLRWT
jgi:hypothetical protein